MDDLPRPCASQINENHNNVLKLISQFCEPFITSWVKCGISIDLCDEGALPFTSCWCAGWSRRSESQVSVQRITQAKEDGAVSLANFGHNAGLGFKD